MNSSYTGSRSQLETRIGLVMYGGVSLAVYENGVAQEMFKAVHGEGVYGLVEKLARTNIVVDVISGTSAGGINGIMLAFALANGGEYSNSATLWREHGDLLRLLRKPDDPVMTSLLDSEGYFQARLVEGLTKLLPDPARKRPVRCPEIDLYVTGTNVRGNVYTTCDDFGHSIDVKDHRAVFKLCFRRNRKNEFGLDEQLPKVRMKDRIDALATLSRITSCFPVAFAPVVVNPVFEPPGLDDPRQVDYLLTRWGQLKSPCAFLDGGVLDNKPFSYTIDAIFGRTAEQPVDRIMFYVEPDPERFPLGAATASVAVPNVLEAAIDALITVPSYESIGADLKSIAERNTRLSHYQEVREALDYLKCPQDHLDLTLDALESADSTRYRMYSQSRLVHLRTIAVASILRIDADHVAQPANVTHRHAANMLAESFNQWRGDGAATLCEFDIFYRQRRTTHLIYAVRELLFGGRAAALDAQQRENYHQMLWRLNELFELQEMLRFVMQGTLDRFQFDLEPLTRIEKASADVATPHWATIQNLLRAVLKDGPTLHELQQWYLDAEADRAAMDRHRNELRNSLCERRARLSTKGAVPELPEAPNLLQTIEALESAIVRQYTPDRKQDPIYIEFVRFLWIDANLLPIEQCGGIAAKDILRTVRISPIDAQRAFGRDKTVADKLCGDMLGHFAGFLKRSWRSNDIMWGRLDAVTQLIETVLPVERLKAIQPAQVNELNLEAIFPAASEQDLVQLKQLLDVLAANHRDEDANHVLEHLVNVAQAEILHEEVPRVLDDAILQQREWNSYEQPRLPVTPPFDVRTGRWTVGVRSLDRSIMDYAAAQLLAQGITKSSTWAQFFRTRPYRVGQEQFPADIPSPVLLEMGTRLALALRNCLLGVFPEPTRKAIQGNLLFKLGLNLPLYILHKVACFQRSAPEFARVGITILVTTCIVLMVVPIVVPTAQLNLGHWLAFLVVPVIILFALGITGVSSGIYRAARLLWRALASVSIFALSLLALSALAAVLWAFGIHVGLIHATSSTWMQSIAKNAASIVQVTTALVAGLVGAFSGTALYSVMRGRSKSPRVPSVTKNS